MLKRLRTSPPFFSCRVAGCTRQQPSVPLLSSARHFSASISPTRSDGPMITLTPGASLPHPRSSHRRAALPPPPKMDAPPFRTRALRAAVGYLRSHEQTSTSCSPHARPDSHTGSCRGVGSTPALGPPSLLGSHAVVLCVLCGGASTSRVG
ncbi:hypothetical protein OH77DRAFT_709007 [Trametes cingulata]|nr:hypothetical protein OH77DRAFT_709007 [Trametes cingulata]